jgi:hypothetical protein
VPKTINSYGYIAENSSYFFVTINGFTKYILHRNKLTGCGVIWNKPACNEVIVLFENKEDKMFFLGFLTVLRSD